MSRTGLIMDEWEEQQRSDYKNQSDVNWLCKQKLPKTVTSVCVVTISQKDAGKCKTLQKTIVFYSALV